MPGADKAGELPVQDSAWTPRGEEDRQAVSAELARILNDPLFRNSRRYPSFLRYVVEQSLQGDADALKERTIGIEVFNRPPDYDTNVDHSVRNVAVEVRKRLNDYYADPAHAAGLRIEIPPGSYAPVFRREAPPGTGDAESAPASAAPDAPAAAPPRTSARRAAAAGVLLLVLLALAAIAYWMKPRPDAVERFWAPLLASGDTVQFFIAGPRLGPEFAAPGRPAELLTFPEAAALVELTARARGYRREVRVAYAGSSRVSDLYAGSSVLLGTADDELVAVMTAPHRFHFQSSPDAFTLVDSQGPVKTLGVVARHQPASELVADFAVVHRVRGRYSGRNLVILSAATALGVAGAARFITSAQSLELLARSAPPGWEDRNVEVALRIRIDRGSPFPAEIQALHLW